MIFVEKRGTGDATSARTPQRAYSLLMPWTASDLDFAIVDRARTLGDLLRLLFAMVEAVGPKAVSDLLNDFDGLSAIDPETAGRWLRNERRPSTQHLRLIVRLLQSRGLMGSPPARDRVFIRIAAFYAKLEGPQINAIVPIPPPIANQMRIPRTTGEVIGSRFRALREDYELALALQRDLRSEDSNMTQFEARMAKPRPIPQALSRVAPEFERLMSSLNAKAPLTPSPSTAPLSRWKRLVRRLRAFVGPS